MKGISRSGMTPARNQSQDFVDVEKVLARFPGASSNFVEAFLDAVKKEDLQNASGSTEVHPSMKTSNQRGIPVKIEIEQVYQGQQLREQPQPKYHKLTPRTQELVGNSRLYTGPVYQHQDSNRPVWQNQKVRQLWQLQEEEQQQKYHQPTPRQLESVEVSRPYAGPVYQWQQQQFEKEQQLQEQQQKYHQVTEKASPAVTLGQQPNTQQRQHLQESSKLRDGLGSSTNSFAAVSTRATSRSLSPVTGATQFQRPWPTHRASPPQGAWSRSPSPKYVMPSMSISGQSSGLPMPLGLSGLSGFHVPLVAQGRYGMGSSLGICYVAHQFGATQEHPMIKEEKRKKAAARAKMKAIADTDSEGSEGSEYAPVCL